MPQSTDPISAMCSSSEEENMKPREQRSSGKRQKDLHQTFSQFLVLAILVLLPAAAIAQNPPAPAGNSEDEGKTVGTYRVKQAIEFGGHISDSNGSQELWNTFVNLHSGPR